MNTAVFRTGAVIAAAMAGLASLGRNPAEAQSLSPALEKAKAAIVDGETKWVAAIVSGKTDDLKQILADDFQGVDSDGNVYNRDVFLAEIVEAPKYYKANTLNGVNVRFINDTTAVTQGDETFERVMDPKRARFVFTDTWVLRNGTWQVFATASVIAPEAKK